jgi:hypothetical protein
MKIIDLKGKHAGSVHEIPDEAAKLFLRKNHFSKGGRYIAESEKHKYLQPEEIEVTETLGELTHKTYDEVEGKPFYEATSSAKQYAEENNIDLTTITPKNGVKITLNDLK